MGVQAYYSTDASAPALTGQAGSLTSLLDACLVNGYGSKTALGWTIAYTGTNKRDYKQGAGSNGYYLDVNDAAPNNAQEAQMVGYETVSALATGTQPFPTTAQSSFGVVCRKSATADATARKWYLFGDSTCFYLFVDTGDLTAPSYSTVFMFGDIFAYKSADGYNTAIVGRFGQNSSSMGNEALQALNQASNVLASGYPGAYLDRHWSGVGGSQPFGRFSSLLMFTNGAGGSYSQGGVSVAVPGDVQSQGFAYPNGPDGALELAPVFAAHSSAVRGYMKGLWVPLHRQPLGHGDTFQGTGNMAGKSFQAFNVCLATGGSFGLQGGQYMIETSNTWS